MKGEQNRPRELGLLAHPRGLRGHRGLLTQLGKKGFIPASLITLHRGSKAGAPQGHCTSSHRVRRVGGGGCPGLHDTWLRMQGSS